MIRKMLLYGTTITEFEFETSVDFKSLLPIDSQGFTVTYQNHRNACGGGTSTDMNKPGSRIQWSKLKPPEMTNLEYQNGGQTAFPIHKQASLF